MNKKEVLELKRRLKKDQATFSRLVGCYVDCNHENSSGESHKLANGAESTTNKAYSCERVPNELGNPGSIGLNFSNVLLRIDPGV